MSCLGLCGSEAAVAHLILSLTKPSEVTLSDLPVVLFRLAFKVLLCQVYPPKSPWAVEGPSIISPALPRRELKPWEGGHLLRSHRGVGAEPGLELSSPAVESCMRR